MVSDPREFTMPFKNAQSKLIEYAAPTPSKAARLLSMVFELGGLLLLGVWGGEIQTPCLANMLPGRGWGGGATRPPGWPLARPHHPATRPHQAAT